MLLKRMNDEGDYSNKETLCNNTSHPYEENSEDSKGELLERTFSKIVVPEVLTEEREEDWGLLKENSGFSTSLLKEWLNTAATALKSGQKGVAIIVALGLTSIPLMMTGSPWVAPIIAFGAVLVAILSC